MKNQGEFDSNFITVSGDSGKIVYQAADVRKTLCAVSALNNKGNGCWFDGDSSYILPASCPELVQIRQLVQQAKKKIRMHMKNGVYTVRSWAKPSPFQGQGR